MKNIIERSTRRGAVAVACIAAVLAAGIPLAYGQSSGSPAIQFLSPASFEGEVPTLTDDAEDVNTSYRLSAWTANAPAGALVEFELLPGDSITQPITIGSGRPVLGDTFEYDWDIAEGPTGVLEGTHTLKATLYASSSEELAATTQTVNIVHGSAPQTNGEASIDLLYPVSGGPLGQYTNALGKTNSVFDSVKLDGSTVKAYFTTSAPGTKPEWRVCNSGEADVNFPDGVRCTYPADDPETDGDEGIDPLDVTAVALNLAREDGSSDVARVVPYAQSATLMNHTILGRSATTGGPSTSVEGTRRKDKNEQTGLFPCSDWIRVSLVDQVGRKIAGANLDAHAQGPSDQLKFHNGHLSAPLGNPGLLPPNQGHSFPETAARCRTDHDATGQQGEHGLAGQPDRKHVETRLGTGDGGTFDLALSTDQPGTTQVTVWAEHEDDDRFCRGEEGSSTSTSLAWGTEVPPVQPESAADCGNTEPTPDPTETESPTFDGSRTARVEPSRQQVVAGRRVRLVGILTAVDEACHASQTIKLRAKRPGATWFRTIAMGTTDALGTHTFRVVVKRTKRYKVVAPRAGECVRAVSPGVTIRAV